MWVPCWTASWPCSIVVWFHFFIREYLLINLIKLTSSLGPCQIDNIQKALARITFIIKRLNFDLKNMMTPAWSFVDSIVFEDSFLLRHHNYIHELLRIIDWYPHLTRTEYFTLVAFNFKVLVLILRQKVSYIFTIDFKGRNLEFNLFAMGLFITFDFLLNIKCYSRKDTSHLCWLVSLFIN